MTQKILSHSLSLHRQPSLFTQANDHDVEPSRGRSSLITRRICLLNPPLPSPYHRPSPRCLILRLIWRVSALLLPWRSRTRCDTITPSSSSLHLRQELHFILLYPPIEGALLPRLPPDSVSWRPRLHRRGPTPPTRPSGNSLHLLWRLQSPPCRPIN